MKRPRVVFAIVVGAAIMVALGRWERDRYSAETSARMAEVARAVGPSIVAPSLGGTFSAGPGTCLTYDLDARVHAVSLCFDGAGRLLETTDARGGATSFETFRFDPDLARVSVAAGEVDRAVRLLDTRSAVTLATGTAIGSIRRCIAWAAAAARARRPKLPKASGAAARSCRDDAAIVSALVQQAEGSPLIDQALNRALQAAERVLAEAARTLDVAATRGFGLLRRRQAAIAAYRALRRDAVVPLAALQAARREVAAPA